MARELPYLSAEGFCGAPFEVWFSFMVSLLVLIKIWQLYAVNLWGMLRWEECWVP